MKYIYLRLFEITCKHVYEFRKTQRLQKNIEKNKEICFSFDILGSIRIFWNITTCKMFI
jgi:hypothetical protein